MYTWLSPILVLLLAFPLLAQEIYKWEDDKGVVHYGDTPAHPAAVPLQTDELPYSHTGSLPAESPAEKKARLRQERDEARLERQMRLPNASPSLTKPKAWIERNGRLRLAGKVRNGGKGLCDAPAIEIVIFDDNGNEDGRFETIAAANTLARGEEAGFEGEYFTPVGESLSWDAAPRCGGGDGVVYGAHKRGSVKMSHSRTIRLKRWKTR
jgi:hypothetical protein